MPEEEPEVSQILADTKALLGIPSDVTEFDSQLVIHINNSLFGLKQLGVGDVDFVITESEGDIDGFLGEDAGEIASAIQMYIYVKVRLLFDPPTSSFVLSALQSTISEYEWRLEAYASTQ